MPLRKDHLMLVTDAGVTLHLGWDYDIPYHLDPLNGVDVDLQLAQGVNQIGNTVERQVVSGVYRTLTADCWSEHGDADAKLILDALPFFTKGTLYFGDKWFCRFVLSKTPYTSQYHPYPRIEALLYCEKPYWYGLTAQTYRLGGFTPAFRFPVCYTRHRYSVRNDNTFINAINPGSLPVPLTAVLRSYAPVENPRVVNVLTGESLKLNTTLQRGDAVEIYRDTADRIAVKLTRAGVESNLFAALDEDSTLTELPPGDNLLKAEADSGTDVLEVSVSFYPAYAGILPEVLA